MLPALVAGGIGALLCYHFLLWWLMQTRGEHRCDCGHRHPCPPSEDGYTR